MKRVLILSVLVLSGFALWSSSGFLGTASAAPTSTIVSSLIVNNLKGPWTALCLHVNGSGYISTSTADCGTGTSSGSGTSSTTILGLNPNSNSFLFLSTSTLGISTSSPNIINIGPDQAYLVSADLTPYALTSDLSEYLPLGGGTMGGAIDFGGSDLFNAGPYNFASGIALRSTDNTHVTFVGATGQVDWDMSLLTTPQNIIIPNNTGTLALTSDIVPTTINGQSSPFTFSSSSDIAVSSTGSNFQWMFLNPLGYLTPSGLAGYAFITATSTAFEVPLTFGSNLVRSGNAISVTSTPTFTSSTQTTLTALGTSTLVGNVGIGIVTTTGKLSVKGAVGTPNVLQIVSSTDNPIFTVAQPGKIFTNAAGDEGFKADFFGNSYNLGRVLAGSYLSINGSAVSLVQQGGGSVVLSGGDLNLTGGTSFRVNTGGMVDFNASTNVFNYGDLSNSFGVLMAINSKLLNVAVSGGNMLSLDGGNGVYGIGDISAGLGNGTYISIDDTGRLIHATNLPTARAGAIDMCWDGDWLAQSTPCVSSSAKLKRDMKPLTGALDSVLKLKPITYRYKDGYYNGSLSVGFTAQDVYKIDPRLVTLATQNQTLKDGTKIKIGEPLAIKYELLTAHLAGAIQDIYGQFQKLVARVSGLEKKLDAQQKQIDSLQNQINALKK